MSLKIETLLQIPETPFCPQLELLEGEYDRNYWRHKEKAVVDSCWNYGPDKDKMARLSFVVLYSDPLSQSVSYLGAQNCSFCSLMTLFSCPESVCLDLCWTTQHSHRFNALEKKNA